MAVCLIGFTGCDDTPKDNNKGGGTETVDKSGPAYTSLYICPMHCEGSGAAEPGVCPACGMDYVKNPDHPDVKAAADDHGHSHEDGDAHDHDHDHEDGDDHDHEH